LFNFNPPLAPVSGDKSYLSDSAYSSSSQISSNPPPPPPWKCSSTRELGQIMEETLGSKASEYYLNSPFKDSLLEDVKSTYSTMDLDLEDHRNLCMIHLCFRLLEPSFKAICDHGYTGFASEKGFIRGTEPSLCKKNGYMGIEEEKGFSIQVKEDKINFKCVMILSEGVNDRFHLKVRDFIGKKNSDGILEFWSDHFKICAAVPFNRHQTIPLESNLVQAFARDRLTKYYTKDEIENFDSEDSKTLARAANGTFVRTVLSLKSLRTNEKLVIKTGNTRPSYLFMDFVRGVLISAVYAMNPNGDLMNTHPAKRTV
jgi:hypothetical protein